MFIYVWHSWVTTAHHSATSMSQDNAHHPLNHLGLKLQVIGALPSFVPSAMVGPTISSSVMFLRFMFCSQSSWSWTSGLPFCKSLLTYVPSSRGPPPNPRSQSRQASSLLSPHPPIPLTQTIWWLLTLTKESLHFKNSHKSSISDSLSLSKFLRIPAPTSLCFPHRLKSSSISSFSRWWNVLEWDLGGSIIWKCPHLWDRGLATPPFLMWDERWGTQLSGETFPLNLKWGWVPVEMEPGWCLLSLCSWNNEASESRAFPLEPSSWLSSQFCSCGPYLMMKKWKGKFTYWDERPFQLSDMFQL